MFNQYNNVIKEQVDAGIVEVEFPQHCSRNELNLQINENDSMKVLGITWKKAIDKLIFNLSCICDSDAKEQVTKRLILGSFARFYNPLGQLSQVTVPLTNYFRNCVNSRVTGTRRYHRKLVKGGMN